MTKWLGNKTCDICGDELRSFPWFADCRIISPEGRRCWAVVCPECHSLHAEFNRFGPGVGQQYDGETFQKIKG